MKKSRMSFLALLTLISLLLDACSLPRRDLPGLTVHMDFPYNQGTILPLGVSVQVRTQAYSPGGGVLRFQFFASGLDIGVVSSPSSSGDFSNAEVSWTPPAPGDYYVQAEAIRASDSAVAEPIHVCVFAEDLLLVDYAYGFTGACTIPPRDPGAPTVGEVTMTAVGSPRSLAYHWTGCTTSLAPQTLSFTANVEDPADLVAFVIVEIQGPGELLSDRLSLTHTSSTITGGKIFTGTTADLEPGLEIEFAGEVGSINWTARAIGRSGELLAEDGPHSVPAAPCVAPVVGEAMPLIIAPTETETPAPSEATCPPGTYYAPATNQCIAIKLPGSNDNGGKPDKGNSGSAQCSDYGSKDKCSSAGCSWDPDKNTCN